MEYATQDADPKVFEPMREPINERAAAFRQRLIDTEPKHLDAVLEFAARAYRRPLTDAEAKRAACALRQPARAGDAARRSVPADAGARARRAGVSLSRREARRRARARPGYRLGTGEPAELFPLVVAARRGTAPARRRRPACAIRTRSSPRRGACCATPKRAGWRPSSPASGCTSTTSISSMKRASGTSRRSPACAARCTRSRFGSSPTCFRTMARCSTSSTPTTRS